MNNLVGDENIGSILKTSLHFSLIDGFLSIKEDIWDTNKVLASDFKEKIWDTSGMVEVKKPTRQCRRHPEYSSLQDYLDSKGSRNLIEEIRNGLMHHRYLMCEEGIYISNPQIPGVHKNDFEALIKRDFFDKWIELARIDREKETILFDDGGIAWSRGFDKYNKDKLFKSGKKYKLLTKHEGSLEDLGKINYSRSNKREFSENEVEISSDIVSFLDDFFKNHEFTLWNLKFALTECLKYNISSSNVNMRYYIRSLLRGIKYESLSYNSFSDGMVHFGVMNELTKVKNKLKDGDGIIKNAVDELTLGAIDEWKIWKDGGGLTDYFNKRFLPKIKEKCSVKYMRMNEKDKKQWYVWFMNNINKVKDSLNYSKKEDSLCLELLPNYLKTSYIANWYINNPGIHVTPRGNDPKNDDEHLRNAFAHSNYVILPGVDKILVWDPPLFGGSYWEKSYNIEDLYKMTVSGQIISDGLGYDRTV